MAGLKDRLKADRVAAMKARDTLARDTLGMALTALQLEEVSGEVARELSDDEVLAVLTREVAKRRDSASAYAAGKRQELADKELAEAALLQAYLPAALTEAELDVLVAEEVAAAAEALGAAPTLRNMGQVVKAVNARVKGRAEGAVVAAKVKAALG
jgi:uncharacterized protein YqeY